MTPDGPVGQRVLPLSLTFDHRVVTGGEAARFLKALMDDLAQPD
jgi:pyruvate dehydrogenase E2 component (dihydrolipoamide acetyltransferase)